MLVSIANRGLQVPCHCRDNWQKRLLFVGQVCINRGSWGTTLIKTLHQVFLAALDT
jgi:hypothetical protein